MSGNATSQTPQEVGDFDISKFLPSIIIGAASFIGPMILVPEGGVLTSIIPLLGGVLAGAVASNDGDILKTFQPIINGVVGIFNGGMDKIRGTVGSFINYDSPTGYLFEIGEGADLEGLPEETILIDANGEALGNGVTEGAVLAYVPADKITEDVTVDSLQAKFGDTTATAVYAEEEGNFSYIAANNQNGEKYTTIDTDNGASAGFADIFTLPTNLNSTLSTAK